MIESITAPLLAFWAAWGADLTVGWLLISLLASAINEGVRRARAEGWAPSPALSFLLGLLNGLALNLDKTREAVLWARGLGLLPAAVGELAAAREAEAKERAGRLAAEVRVRLLEAEVARLGAGGAP